MGLLLHCSQLLLHFDLFLSARFLYILHFTLCGSKLTGHHCILSFQLPHFLVVVNLESLELGALLFVLGLHVLSLLVLLLKQLRQFGLTLHLESLHLLL